MSPAMHSTSARPERRSPLHPLLFLVTAFVNTFGITQPTPAGARRAARILGWVLLGFFLIALAVAFLVHRAYLQT